jgi:phosphatidylglycerophosphate synthase
MIDAYIRPLIDPPLTKVGALVAKAKISANTVTFIGFLFGLAAMFSIAFGQPTMGGFLFILNRISDGLDGGVARATKMSDFGGYLDIMSDFIIYPGIPLAFCFYDPTFALPATFLVFAMAGAMTSFLAYAILCAKNNITSEVRGKKSFYYLGGICEGFETCLFLGLMCFFPSFFPLLAFVFGGLCLCTTAGRILQTRATFKT